MIEKELSVYIRAIPSLFTVQLLNYTSIHTLFPTSHLWATYDSENNNIPDSSEATC